MGLHNASEIEKLLIGFCRNVLTEKKSTVNMMIYSELGRFPLLINRKISVVKYWLRLLKTDNCILKTLYADMLPNCNLNDNENFLQNLTNMLLSLGFADMWYSQNVYCENVFLNVFKQRLIDNFLQERNAFLNHPQVLFI